MSHLGDMGVQAVPAPAASLLGDLGVDLASTSFALARRFAANATMWCWSPHWPHHANHLAVEFVHPVIVGKRALPAVTLDGPDPVATLRTLARPGDILVAVAAWGQADVAGAMAGGQAQGLETVCIGAGRRPGPGAADHLLWLDADPALAAMTGRFVLVYHLLWELTHVCFEHPGLLRPPALDGAAGFGDTVGANGHRGEGERHGR